MDIVCQDGGPFTVVGELRIIKVTPFVALQGHATTKYAQTWATFVLITIQINCVILYQMWMNVRIVLVKTVGSALI